MTEAEWLVSVDPAAMLYHAQHIYVEIPNGFSVTARTPTVSDRKLRLFAEAAGCDSCRMLAEHRNAAFWADSVSKCTSCKPAAEKANYLREIIGNPCRPVWKNYQRHLSNLESRREKFIERDLAAWLTWNDGLIPHMASHAYVDRHLDGTLATDNLLVLADALEDAGCPADEVCHHCDGWKCLIRAGKAKPLSAYSRSASCPWCRATGRLPNQLLAHLRSPGPHVRGCWVIDLLTGRE